MPRTAKTKTASVSVSTLEARIQAQAVAFAREIVAALRSAPLSDIAALSGGLASQVFPSGARRGRPPKSAGILGEVIKPKRKVSNYPKCKWGDCGRNMSPRTRPYCGEHWRREKAGETPPPPAEGKGAAAPAKRKPGRPRKAKSKRGPGRPRKAARG